VYGLQLRALRRRSAAGGHGRAGPRLRRPDQDHAAARPLSPVRLVARRNIAHAIAEELERRGAQVGLLAIGDATPDLPQHIRVVDEDKLWMLCAFVLRRFGYQP